jgi:hypothetical protein
MICLANRVWTWRKHRYTREESGGDFRDGISASRCEPPWRPRDGEHSETGVQRHGAWRAPAFVRHSLDAAFSSSLWTYITSIAIERAEREA